MKKAIENLKKKFYLKIYRWVVDVVTQDGDKWFPEPVKPITQPVAKKPSKYEIFDELYEASKTISLREFDENRSVLDKIIPFIYEQDTDKLLDLVKLKRSLFEQPVPDEEVFSTIRYLYRNKRVDLIELSLIYDYGVIRGKQEERAKKRKSL